MSRGVDILFFLIVRLLSAIVCRPENSLPKRHFFMEAKCYRAMLRTQTKMLRE